jgi:DNA-binding winged helix-turn-helix (wHTH) protein/tetratricopeptide (TPR) repeat protein
MTAQSKIRFGDFEADLRAGELRKHGYRLRLQEKPFQVLAAILERPGDLVTRDELHQRLWGTDTFVDFDNNLNTAVYKLREALGDTTDTPRYIETRPKKGYRFIGTIEAAPPATANTESVAAAVGAAPPPRARRWRLAAACALVAALIAAASYIAVATSSTAASARNSAAQEAFLKGRYFMDKGGAENLQRAAAYFEQSIAGDPGFARAHAELANALAAFPSDRRDHSARARAAALKAIELEPKLADAHHRLAAIYMYEDWNWNGAGEEFARAARLAPDSATIHHSYAGYFSAMGRHDLALDEMLQALRLDPVSVAVSADTGWYWFVARRYDEAIAQSKKALELEATHRGAHYYVLLALLAKGDAVEARDWAAKYLALLGGTQEEIVRVTTGEPDAGLSAFWQIRLSRAQERATAEPVPAQELALLYASLGDTENALFYLDQAYEEHTGWLLPFMRVYPPLDALRTHPRFLALESRMNFPSP